MYKQDLALKTYNGWYATKPNWPIDEILKGTTTLDLVVIAMRRHSTFSRYGASLSNTV